MSKNVLTLMAMQELVCVVGVAIAELSMSYFICYLHGSKFVSTFCIVSSVKTCKYVFTCLQMCIKINNGINQMARIVKWCDYPITANQY